MDKFSSVSTRSEHIQVFCKWLPRMICRPVFPGYLLTIGRVTMRRSALSTRLSVVLYLGCVFISPPARLCKLRSGRKRKKQLTNVAKSPSNRKCIPNIFTMWMKCDAIFESEINDDIKIDIWPFKSLNIKLIQISYQICKFE